MLCYRKAAIFCICYNHAAGLQQFAMLQNCSCILPMPKACRMITIKTCYAAEFLCCCQAAELPNSLLFSKIAILFGLGYCHAAKLQHSLLCCRKAFVLICDEVCILPILQSCSEIIKRIYGVEKLMYSA